MVTFTPDQTCINHAASEVFSVEYRQSTCKKRRGKMSRGTSRKVKTEHCYISLHTVLPRLCQHPVLAVLAEQWHCDAGDAPGKGGSQHVLSARCCALCHAKPGTSGRGCHSAWLLRPCSAPPYHMDPSMQSLCT